MTHSAYTLVDEGEDFDREFRSFIERFPKRAGRLLTALEAFPHDPEGCGDLVRGSGKRALHVVPKRGPIDDAAAVVVLVDQDPKARTVKPVRLLEGGEAADWHGIVRWAEEYLGNPKGSPGAEK
jgi:hypothetical protein